MEPTGFPETNLNLGPPDGMNEDQVRTIQAFRGQWGGPQGPPCVITCWKPTAAELEEFLRTGRLWLVAMGVTMPPVVVTMHAPFRDPAGEERS